MDVMLNGIIGAFINKRFSPLPLAGPVYRSIFSKREKCLFAVRTVILSLTFYLQMDVVVSASKKAISQCGCVVEAKLLDFSFFPHLALCQRHVRLCIEFDHECDVLVICSHNDRKLIYR